MRSTPAAARNVSPERRGTCFSLPPSYAERDDQPFERGGKDNVFPHRLPATAAEIARRFGDFPWMDSLTAEFALEGVRRLGLGKRGKADLLSVSFSTTDAVGHQYGPDSRELHDHLLRLDRWLGRFLDSLAVLVPAESTLVALTADHGVQSLPELTRARGKRAQRIWLGEFADRTGRAAHPALPYRLQPLFRERAAVGRHRRVERPGHQRGQPGVRARGSRPSRARRPPGLHPEDAACRFGVRPRGDALEEPDPPELRLAHRAPRSSRATSGRRRIKPWRSTAVRRISMSRCRLRLWDPGSDRRRIARPVRTVDIAPTLAALLGVRPTERLDGQVLLEVTKGR